MDAVDELNLLLGIGPAKAKLPITLTKSGYSSIKPLGKGGFGQAHLVFHAQTKKYFVVKHINLMQLSSRQRKDAHNEIHILQSLHHPNIVRYCEFCEEHPHLYIVMEYADAGDLAGHLDKLKKARQRLGEDQLVNLFAQTCLAVKYLHDRRILHRDIKSGNVFLTKEKVVKLGDFGISTVLQSTVAMAKTVCGTPVYFSPELCQGKVYNNKSDIWSLGILMYEMATSGDLPYDGRDMKTLMSAIISNPTPHLPAQYYSKNLDDLLQWMLQKDPSDRPDILQVLKHPAIASRMASVTSQLEMFASRPASAVGAGGVAANTNSNATNNLGGGGGAMASSKPGQLYGGGRVFASDAPPPPPPQQQVNKNNAAGDVLGAAAANLNLPPRPKINNNNNVSPQNNYQQDASPYPLPTPPANSTSPPPQPPPRNYNLNNNSSVDPVSEILRQAKEQFQRDKEKFGKSPSPAAGNNNKEEKVKTDDVTDDKKKSPAPAHSYDDQKQLYDGMYHVMLTDSPPHPHKPPALDHNNNQNSQQEPKSKIDSIRVVPIHSSQQQHQELQDEEVSENQREQHQNEGEDELAQVIDELRETIMDEKELKSQAAAARNEMQNDHRQQQDASVVIDVSEDVNGDVEKPKTTFFEDANGTALNLKALIEQDGNKSNQNDEDDQKKHHGGSNTTTSSSSSASNNKDYANVLDATCLCRSSCIRILVTDVIGSFVSGDEFSVKSSGNPGGIEYLHLPEYKTLEGLLATSQTYLNTTSTTLSGDTSNNNNNANARQNNSLKQFLFVSPQDSTFKTESYFCSNCGTRICVFNLPGAKGCCVPRGVCHNPNSKNGAANNSNSGFENFTLSPA